MRDFKTLLDSKGVLVADGAWGTEMIKKGLGQGECPELWNLSRPAEVRAIAEAYSESGADIILTNTFGGNRFRLEKAGAGDKVMEINRRGVELSRETCGDSLVFASMGPTGEFIKPLGDITKEEMACSFKEQISAFVEGGADGVIIETMTDINEMRCAIQAARQNSDLAIAASMTFERGPRGFVTVMGVTAQQATLELAKEQLVALGSNCGSGMENEVKIAQAMQRVTSIPLWAKPNAGVPQLREGRTVYSETPEYMARFVPELLSSGAKVIGGCCGTTPEHIRLIAEQCQKQKEEGG